MYQMLHIQIPLRKLFECRTVEALANLVEASLWKADERDALENSQINGRENIEI
jgi:hypothetical protein